MYYIEFKELSIQNFMSTGNAPVVWDISSSKKTLIQGKNFSGKTTIFQALTFALFGRSYAKIVKKNLVNTINGKGCEVRLKFKISQDDFEIIRGIKPDTFRIVKNGEVIEQSANAADYQEMLEKSIIKMDFKAYTQLIMLGTAGYTPFLQLSAQERRNFVESFLDIEIFTKLNKIFKKDSATNQNKIFELQTKINARKNSINVLESVVENYARDNELRLQTITAEIRELYGNFKSTEVTLAEIDDKLSKIIVDDKIVEDTRASSNKLVSFVSTKKNEATKIRTAIKFFDTNPTCPECEQIVTEDHKQKHLDTYNKQLEEIGSLVIKSEKKQKELEQELNILYANQTNKRNLISQKSNTETKLEWYKSELKKKYNTKQDLEKFDGNNVVSEKKQQLEKELIIQTEEIKSLEEVLTKQEYFDKILLALKDSGAKAEIIKWYIPIICNHVNRNLEKLNLYLKFELDEEFNESLKARHRDPLQFESFSMGERMRINVALLWAWREVAKTKTGIETNLLCFDEILEILDYEGFEELMNLVNDEPKLNCAVISHKVDIGILFDQIINVTKVKGFTQLTVANQ